MNRLSVTIVDILGVLVPGAALLIGLILFPFPQLDRSAVNSALVDRVQLFGNPWVAGGCWLAVAYVLGFLIRLVSIRVMNYLTWWKWGPTLSADSQALEQAFDEALDNPTLAAGLRKLSHLCGKRDPGRYAPFFHFAKRVVRGSPDYWNEAERLEAEVRFAAGLLIPFVVFAADGIARKLATPAAWLLLLTGAVGAITIVLTFPSRRTKEVLYNQLLALAVLIYQPKLSGGKTAHAEPAKTTEQLQQDKKLEVSGKSIEISAKDGAA